MKFFDEEKIHLYLSYVIVTLLFLLSCFMIFWFFKDNKKNKEETKITQVEENKEKGEFEEKEENKEIPITFKVDIKGAVLKPGVYEANQNMVVEDIILLAGGLKNNASTKLLNLAYKVSEQMVIQIFTTNEVKELNKEIKEICICPEVEINSCENASIVIPEKKEEDKNSTISKEDANQKDNLEEKKDPTNTLISINKATIKELTTLSGIGEAKAKAIVLYREKNGPFKNLEDIKKVSGIGETVYQKIKNFIKL